MSDTVYYTDLFQFCSVVFTIIVLCVIAATAFAFTMRFIIDVIGNIHQRIYHRSPRYIARWCKENYVSDVQMVIFVELSRMLFFRFWLKYYPVRGFTGLSMTCYKKYWSRRSPSLMFNIHKDMCVVELEETGRGLHSVPLWHSVVPGGVPTPALVGPIRGRSSQYSFADPKFFTYILRDIKNYRE